MPAASPDLNPLDFCIWSYLEQRACDRVFTNIATFTGIVLQVFPWEEVRTSPKAIPWEEVRTSSQALPWKKVRGPGAIVSGPDLVNFLARK